MNTWNNATISENNQQRLFSRDLYSNYPLATSDPSNRNLPSNDFGVANFSGFFVAGCFLNVGNCNCGCHGVVK